MDETLIKLIALVRLLSKYKKTYPQVFFHQRSGRDIIEYYTYADNSKG